MAFPSAKRASGRTQQQIVQQYKKMLDLAARRGITVTPSTTPTEVLELIQQGWGEAESAVVN